MRYVCPAFPATLPAVVALSMFPYSAMFGQTAQQSTPAPLSIMNYQLVMERHITATQSDQTYQADIMNTGAPLSSVTATLISLDPSHIRVVQGQSTLIFAAVPANGQAKSSNSFTILVDRTVPLDFAKLQWIYRGPIADAGSNTTARKGTTVVLNGSASSNPSGTGTLSYRWEFSSVPLGSKSALKDASSVMPSFVPDLSGTYVVKLTVDNGAATSSASVTVSTANSPPVAQAGPNRTVVPGSSVSLNGAGSCDVDGDPLIFSWNLILQPAGSTATLIGADTFSPSFTADQPGTYVAQLIVNDGANDSNPASVTITTGDTAPVANAGLAQVVSVGTLAQLNGARSSDVNGDLLSYQWALISIPAGSTAKLSSTTAVNPTFTVDVAGTYIAQLIANDGRFNSAPATVVITTDALVPPIANAGLSQTVTVGGTVSLNGSGMDPQGLLLAYQWSLIAKPTGSTATLSDATSASPSFFADVAGTYLAQLVVNNGSLSSTAATSAITTSNTPPVADAGPNQNVLVDATVTLDGSGSSDADRDPLAYSWSFLSRPNGSSATLLAAHSSAPTFVADVAGTYVVQLIVSDTLSNSNPATVVITAATTSAITLTPNPLNLGLRATGTLTIMLPAPAGPGDEVVYLSTRSLSE